MLPVLRVSGLNKSFVMHAQGGLALSVLEDVALSVAPGECAQFSRRRRLWFAARANPADRFAGRMHARWKHRVGIIIAAQLDHETRRLTVVKRQLARVARFRQFETLRFAAGRIEKVMPNTDRRTPKGRAFA